MKPLNKAGQFSQLTLEGFGPRDIVPTDEHRWPEGFTPERRNRVAESLSITQHFPGDSDEHAIHPYSDNRGGTDTGINDIPNLGERRVIAAVARSSVPTEHLQNWRNKAPLPITTGSDDVSGALGWFTPETGRVNVGDRTRKQSESERADVLLHEIGHSVSNLTGTPHSQADEWKHERETGMEHPMSSSVRHGREEAFADNYAVQHRGGRRGEELPRFTSGYEKPGMLGATYGLAAGVRSAHYGPSPSAQADIEYNAARIRQPKEKVKPAGSNQFWEAPLFGRNADQINTDTERDFGQFGWFSNVGRSGGKLDSIRLGGGAPSRAERMKPGFTPQDVDLMANHTEQMMARQWTEHVNTANDPTVSKKQRKASRLEANTRLGIGRMRKRQGYGNA